MDSEKVLFLAALIVYIFLAWAIDRWAKSRDCPYSIFFLLSLVLTPLLACPLVLITTRKKPKAEVTSFGPAQREQDRKKCPFCAEMIREEAQVCRYCGRDLPAKLPK